MDEEYHAAHRLAAIADELRAIRDRICNPKSDEKSSISRVCRKRSQVSRRRRRTCDRELGPSLAAAQIEVWRVDQVGLVQWP